MRTSFGNPLLPALALLLFGATAAPAQTATLDEGTFRILLNGRDVATETFSIRQTGAGAAALIIAQGRVAPEGPGIDPLTASLELAGAGLRPAAYQIDLQGETPQRIAGRIVGGRFSARIRSGAGESMREYLASEGAILLDDGVAHHYYFLARRLDGSPLQVPVLIPRQSRQVTAQVTRGAGESVEIGGVAVAATRFTVNADGVERRVWADAQGRILRLEIPAQGLVAVRTAAPR
jgi:hypothetical protein